MVQRTQTVHMKMHVFELINVELLDGGLAVGADGHGEGDGNVTDVGINLYKHSKD